MRSTIFGRLSALLVLAWAPVHALAPTCSAPPALTALSDSVQELVRKVEPSVVKVVAVGFLRPEDDSGDTGVVSRGQSSGSGVIVAPNGLIVTNAHVVSGADQAQVTIPPAALPAEEASGMQRRGKVLLARVIGMDAAVDVALLKVPLTGLPYLPLADSDMIRQGQAVVALGSPRGLENTVTFGVVSATARQFDPEDPIAYVQTDAPINPGSSGGPLVDAAGRVIGINTLFLSQSGGNEGLGFAVPSNLVGIVLEQLRRNGRVVHGDIGLQVRTITATLAAALRLPAVDGVLVRDVEPDAPADRAGIEPGDVITAVNGKPLTTPLGLNLALDRAAVGSRLQLDIHRGGHGHQVEVAVQAEAAEAARVAAAVHARNLVPQLGIFVLDVDESLAAEAGQSRGTGGVLVAAILADSPAMGEDLRFGDIIYRVNRRRVTSAKELRTLLNDLKPGAPVAFQVEREGQLHFVAMELP
jgi:serine protease Do